LDNLAEMKSIIRSTVLLAAILATYSANGFDYQKSIQAIAIDIESLKEDYPQLKDFSVAEHLRANRHEISYSYHTHKSTGQGGWTSGVPNPDEDGIWFYIDFHDPESASQIHTQPAIGIPYCVGNMRLSFLSLEGTKTKSVQGPIWHVLKKYGATECNR
jgi:hypothetical protein